MSSELQAPNKCHKSHSQCAKLFSVFLSVCQFDLLPGPGRCNREMANVSVWAVWGAIFPTVMSPTPREQFCMVFFSQRIRVTGSPLPRRRKVNAWSLINSHIICFIRLSPPKTRCPCRWFGKSAAIVMRMRVITLLLAVSDFFHLFRHSCISILTCQAQIWDVSWLMIIF